MATRFVAPGKIAWRAAAGQSLEELCARFTGPLNWRAAIVGPHGSGKSTLLENLVPLLGMIELRSATYELPSDAATKRTANNDVNSFSNRGSVDQPANGRRIVWLNMRGRSQSRRLLFRTFRAWAKRDCLLVIDGYEQLSLAARGAALLLTRISGAGILVTSHQPTALETLVQTRVDVPLARELIDRLLPEDFEDRARLLDANRLQQLLAKHHGNLREVFMELYDEL